MEHQKWLDAVVATVLNYRADCGLFIPEKTTATVIESTGSAVVRLSAGAEDSHIFIEKEDIGHNKMSVHSQLSYAIRSLEAKIVANKSGDIQTSLEACGIYPVEAPDKTPSHWCPRCEAESAIRADTSHPCYGCGYPEMRAVAETPDTWVAPVIHAGVVDPHASGGVRFVRENIDYARRKLCAAVRLTPEGDDAGHALLQAAIVATVKAGVYFAGVAKEIDHDKD
ncbi:MAG: hypothetical protein V3W44_09660 [Dehalococcoidales bacterium]